MPTTPRSRKPPKPSKEAKTSKASSKAASKDSTHSTPKKPDWEDRFLTLLESTFSVAAAASGAGIDRGTAYKRRDLHPDFRAKWEAALANAMDGLEEAAYRRAREMSDTLAIFLLKTRRPDLYRDRQDVTTTTMAINYADLTDEQLQRIANGEHPATVIASTSGR